MSPFKSQLIYNAVHERIMDLRVHLCRKPVIGDALDSLLAEAGEKIAVAAVAAYETKMKRRKP